MGMVLKPSKCRSFTISSGKPKEETFKLGEFLIPSIKTLDQKFLGRLLFIHMKTECAFNLLKETIESKMTRIDQSYVRDEYKIWIYSKYLIPSLRFLLTVHRFLSFLFFHKQEFRVFRQELLLCTLKSIYTYASTSNDVNM